MIGEEELKRTGLIDTHVHRVHPGRSPEFGNLGGGYIPGPAQEIHSRQTLLYHMVMEELRREFGMEEDAPLQQVEEERHKRYERDPQGYFRKLLDGENVVMHCLEVGSPLGGAPYTEQEIAYFDGSVDRKRQSFILRFERVLESVMKERLPFGQMTARYEDILSDQIEREDAVGLKSCAAYAGGLRIRFPDRHEAEKAYERILKGTKEEEDDKILNHYILLESMDIAAGYDLPVQFHTGMGGGSYIDFDTLNPVHLVPFLRHKKVFNRVKIVLLHGGHPHEEEASCLAAQFANVYTDFSGMHYLSSLKGVERMAALLEKAPLDKVMYGSDGVMFPEVSWFSHRHFRRQLAKLLNGLTAGGYMTERRARKAARMFQFDNALDCYTKLRDRVAKESQS